MIGLGLSAPGAVLVRSPSQEICGVGYLFSNCAGVGFSAHGAVQGALSRKLSRVGF